MFNASTRASSWKRLAEMTFTAGGLRDYKISFTRSDIYEELDKEEEEEDEEEEDNGNIDGNSKPRPCLNSRTRPKDREEKEKEEPLPASCLSMEKSSEVIERMGFRFQSEDESSHLKRVTINRVDLRTNAKHAESLETKIRHKQFFRMEKEKWKYWNKRRSLFSMFDDGIQLDEESWYSVTPELLARHIALRMKCSTVIDGFCGAGGNTIQFAMVCDKVIAVDIDPVKIHMARHNAKIYGVEHKIQFVNKDFMDFVPDLRSRADAVFLSPPWGGPAYRNKDRFSLKEVTPDMDDIMAKARSLSSNVAVYLPRNTVVTELVKYSEEGHFEVEQNLLDGRVKTLTIYYGNLVNTGADPISYLPACSGRRSDIDEPYPCVAKDLDDSCRGWSLKRDVNPDKNLRPFYNVVVVDLRDLPYKSVLQSEMRLGENGQCWPFGRLGVASTLEEKLSAPSRKYKNFGGCRDVRSGRNFARRFQDDGGAMVR